jgi:hypothetical protein
MIADLAAPVLDLATIREALCYFPEVKLSPDGSHYIAICPFIYTWAILLGRDEECYDQRWCYESAFDALRAFEAWDGEQGTEPSGWHRHIPSGRRRPHGDPSREHFNP